MPKTADVVFIAGFPRSGSTLLGDLLASQYHCEHIGETQRLFRKVGHERRLPSAASQLVDAGLRHASCSCGQPLRTCERWSYAVQEVDRTFPGVDPHDLDAAMQHHTGMRRRWLLGEPSARMHRERLTSFAETVLSRVAADVGAPLIDSSNFPRYGQLLANAPGLSLRVIHLVRDPRAVVNSRLRSQRGTNSAMGGGLWSSLLIDSRRWARANAAATSLARTSNRTSFLRYEDLAAEPQVQMERVAREVGLRPRRDVRERTARDEQYYVDRQHVLWGNTRAISGWVRVQPDTRWMDELSPAERRLIVALCAPQMRKYGYV